MGSADSSLRLTRGRSRHGFVLAMACSLRRDDARHPVPPPPSQGTHCEVSEEKTEREHRIHIGNGVFPGRRTRRAQGVAAPGGVNGRPCS